MPSFEPPGRDKLTDEELVIGLLLLQNINSPQVIRLAAQLISRGELNRRELARLAVLERVGFVLGSLAQEALRADPEHALWSWLRKVFQNETGPAAPLLHYTRLAEPVMQGGRYNAEKWQLVR
jgi:hypothetical protein